MKGAFSFIEVIISVMILSYLGVAVLNFNSFNKSAMFHNIEKQNSLLISSAMLHNNTKIENGKTYSLNDIVTFKKLSDEDRKFLKDIKLQVDKKVDEKLFLYNDGKKDFFIEYGDINIKYKENKPLRFTFIQRVK